MFAKFLSGWSSRGPRARRTVSSKPLGVEPLEERCLLAADFALLGSEFQVNTFTTGSQSRVQTAMDLAGNFVAVWESNGQDGSGLGIYGQLYSSSGAPIGPEFRVNSHTTGNQRESTVATDAAGNFVVAWSSDGQDGSSYGIFAQRYSSSGATLGSEYQVNTYTSNQQRSPSIALTENGNFVIAWSSLGQDGSGVGIFAQRYDSAGVPQGGEFQVNTFTIGAQQSPRVAMDDAGNFVITWESYGQDGSNFGIFAQRYNAIGTPQGGEFQVNSHTTSQQRSPSIGMSGAGDFVIVWTSLNQDGSNYGIYAQRYNAAGAPQGGEFRVNTHTTGFQYTPNVAMDAGGNFVVAWLSDGQDGSGYGIFAQRYDSSGVSQGGEFRVNTYTTNNQMFPSVAMNANGLLVAWESIGQDDSSAGIFAQRFGPRFLPTVAGDEFLVNTYTTGVQGGGGVALDAAGNFVIVWHSQFQDGTSSSLFGQRYDATGMPLGGEFNINTYTTSAQYFGDLAMDDEGNFVVAWYGFGPISGVNVYLQRFDADGVPLGGPILANTTTTHGQEFPSMAMDAAGNFVVTWSSSAADPTSYNVIGQRFNSSGVPLGGEFQVNTYTTGSQWFSEVAMDALGNFVVIWRSEGQDGSGAGLFGRRYNAAGVPQGGEFQVNIYTTGDQLQPRVAMDPSGNFVVIWSSDGQDGSGHGVYARQFNATGVPMGDEFRVNSYTSGIQRAGSVVMDGTGNFFIAWHGRGLQDTAGNYGQWYDSSGTTMGSEFLINTYTTNTQGSPNVGINRAGQMVISWSSVEQDGSANGVYAQRYERPVGIADVQVRGMGWDPGLPWFPIPVGNSNQLRSLPWTNVDQIRIVFSGPVAISSGDLELIGVNVADYSSLVSSFDYDALTHTATWTLSSPIEADKLRIRLVDGVVVDTSGRPIDGEWTDGMSTYYSGDGTPGGTFAFRFNVLPGDVNGNGSVTTADVALARNRLFTTAGLPGFDLLSDVNGNGSVTTADVSQARNFLFTSLPAGDPASAIPMMASLFLSSSTELFSQPNEASEFAMESSLADASFGTRFESISRVGTLRFWDGDTSGIQSAGETRYQLSGTNPSNPSRARRLAVHAVDVLFADFAHGL